MGEKSRRKREERERGLRSRHQTEKNRAGRKTLNGARASIAFGGIEIGRIDDITYRLTNDIDARRPYSMSAEIKGTFKAIESREELEKKLALAEARARDLEAVLGDRLEEQGMPRSPMLARLAKVPDVEKTLQALYQMGIGDVVAARSMFFGIEGPLCCEAQENRFVTYGPLTHDDNCPLMAALLVLGGAEEEKRREIEFQRRMTPELQRRVGVVMPLIVSPATAEALEAYRRLDADFPSGVPFTLTAPPGEPLHD